MSPASRHDRRSSRRARWSIVDTRERQGEHARGRRVRGPCARRAPGTRRTGCPRRSCAVRRLRAPRRARRSRLRRARRCRSARPRRCRPRSTASLVGHDCRERARGLARRHRRSTLGSAAPPGSGSGPRMFSSARFDRRPQARCRPTRPMRCEIPSTDDPDDEAHDGHEDGETRRAGAARGSTAGGATRDRHPGGRRIDAVDAFGELSGTRGPLRHSGTRRCGAVARAADAYPGSPGWVIRRPSACSPHRAPCGSSARGRRRSSCAGTRCRARRPTPCRRSRTTRPGRGSAPSTARGAGCA